ncbi:MAG: hypothetical protein ACOCVN_03460 [bacterium]
MKTQTKFSEKWITIALWVFTILVLLGLTNLLTSCSPRVPYYAVEIRDEEGQKSYYDFSQFQLIELKGTLLVIDEKGDSTAIQFNDRREVENENN